MSFPRGVRSRLRWSQTPALLLTLAAIVALSATSAVAATTTLYATGVTQPVAGLWLPGTSTSHEWIVDASNGLSRLDGPGASAVFSENTTTCNKSAKSFAQVSLDARANADGTHYLYVLDSGNNSPGVIRLTFGPANDAGNGNQPGVTKHESKCLGSRS
jgi:hypothetical protein